MNDSIAVVLPTYNEADALPAVLARLRQAVPSAHLLVVDDASPDGTGMIADRLAREDPAIGVLHRQGKGGLGPAYCAGFAMVLRQGYRLVVQSDADGSHRPEDLPRLLAAAGDADVVLGSRWVRGGDVASWSWHRRVLSRGGSAYARRLLSLPQRDVTGGYRVFRADALTRIAPDRVHSKGFCFQIEMLSRAVDAGCRVVEVPIRFEERLEGESKMSAGILVEALWQVTRWGVARRLGGTWRPAARTEHAHV